MVESYCNEEDVEHRLDLGDHYSGEVEYIQHCMERAHRWIRHKFAAQGKMDELPDPTEELPADFEILKDIEATRAAYLYKNDAMQWTSDPNSREMKRLTSWKERSKKMLEQLIRRKWGNEFYAFSGR